MEVRVLLPDPANAVRWSLIHFVLVIIMKARIESTNPDFKFKVNVDLSEEFSKLQPNWTEQSLSRLVNKVCRERFPSEAKKLNGRFKKDWTL